MSDETKQPPEVDFPEAAEGNVLVGKSENNQRPRRKQGLFPFMSFHIKDQYMESQVLSPAACGAYFRLICQMWMHGAVLADDDTRLARIVGMTTKRWKRIRAEVLDLFEVADGHITHRIVTQEHGRVVQNSLIKSAAAKCRWNNNKDLAYAHAMLPRPRQEKKRFPISDSPLRELPSPAKYNGNGAVTLTEEGRDLCSALERLSTARKMAK